MLDIKQIREITDVVKQNLQMRGDEQLIHLLEVIVQHDKEWRDVSSKLNDKRAERNTISKQVAELRKEGDDASALIEQTDALLNEIKSLENEEDKLRNGIDKNMMALPNMLHESVPFGKDDQDNGVVRTWGEQKQFSFDVKGHGEIIEALNIGDFERAGKIAGAGFSYLIGDLALLNQAIIQFTINFLTEKGYTFVEPPHMMRRKPYEGVVDLADFESVMYKVEDEDLYLIATSEHPMAAMYMGEIIDEDKLPIKFVGLSINFRKEIGGHGVDTKGLFRCHQFTKVEMFIFCKPEESWQYHEELNTNAEELYQAFAVPYRIVNVCTGDIGTVAAKKYDIETWSPRQEKYVEVGSCSNCTDYQARRLNIRCGKHGGDKRILHTLNSTAVATSRAIVAIIENNQNEDGTVNVPEALRPYMNGKEVIGK